MLFVTMQTFKLGLLDTSVDIHLFNLEVGGKGSADPERNRLLIAKDRHLPWIAVLDYEILIGLLQC